MKIVKNSIILYILLFLIINFFGSLLNATFSDLKVNIFIITSFICSNKYVKQLVLINLPQITKGMGIGVLFILQKMGEGTFFPQKREWLVK